MSAARCAPARTAIVEDGRALSYGELADRVARIAGGLRAAGIGPGDVVAVQLPASAACVASLLGVMAAGAAYLPIDAAVPAARARRYAEIAAACAVVTDADAAGIGVRALDAAALAATRAQADSLQIARGDAVAYVIFTSGSTGEPKGVMCEHHAALSVIRHAIARRYVTPDARIACRTSIGFDLSVWEMFAPLAAGATLVIGSESARIDPEQFLAEAAEQRVTTIQAVPTMLGFLAALPELSDVESLEYIITGGEVLTPELAARTQARSPAVLVNVYGPTETTIFVTSWECPRPAGDDVAIGSPLPGSEIIVVDEAGGLVPPGTSGELLIAGDCVARGYVNRPELTAARFGTHPFREGVRMYRSGDRGHAGADGAMRYDGRTDRQVKISGVRIELDEVESAVRGALGGHHAAVVAAQNRFGDKQMIAFTAGTFDEQQLRVRLHAVLPAAMVPSRLVSLEGFPTLVNGKIDYVALKRDAGSILEGR